ncbi:zinc ribbon domain-containing protein [Fusobacterium sp.]|uniref:zinc ribbon domain-containing protein n=1 Tax=Fusobacterium sp. TaxID=68766 RepID=UPI00396CD176
MFFIGIFGVGNRSKKLADIKFKCTGCMGERFSLMELYKSFDIFFIPVFKFKKEYLIVCEKCKSMYKLKSGSIDRVLETQRAEYEDVERIVFETHTCPKCGAKIVGDYSFCPYCGESLKK